MKKLLFMPILLATNFVMADYCLKINTDKFNIRIEDNCEEGNVSCEDISYSAIRLSDGSRIDLKGGTKNRPKSYSFYGYEFKNNSYTYVLYTAQAMPELVIFHKGKIILAEPIKTMSECTDRKKLKVDKK